MNKIRKVNVLCAIVGLFVIIFDQAIKFSVLAFVPNGTHIAVCQHVNLILTYNYGTSFGLLSPSNAMQYYLIVALMFFCIAFIVYVYTKLHRTTEKLFCSLLIGGAIGNLIDRFVHGAVIDFVDVYYNTWHWPAFNFADACISCSVGLLILYNLVATKS
ncbi:MAG: signal peptidase II [Alphaproteobacteria bacterium]|nr:signal peptidase II [Alphaproteobacteria bacterium]